MLPHIIKYLSDAVDDSSPCNPAIGIVTVTNEENTYTYSVYILNAPPHNGQQTTSKRGIWQPEIRQFRLKLKQKAKKFEGSLLQGPSRVSLVQNSKLLLNIPKKRGWIRIDSADMNLIWGALDAKSLNKQSLSDDWGKENSSIQWGSGSAELFDWRST